MLGVGPVSSHGGPDQGVDRGEFGPRGSPRFPPRASAGTLLSSSTAMSHTSDVTPVGQPDPCRKHLPAGQTVSGQDDGTTFWNVVCFGTPAATSLATGDQVIAVGTVRTRAWTTVEGEARAGLEIVADEPGQSLRWATAEITRVATS
jgi:hypothetical protein